MPLPNNLIQSCIFVIPCILGRLYPLVLLFLGMNSCNDQSTFAISFCACMTSFLSFASCYHSSIPKQSFKKAKNSFHLCSDNFKHLFTTALPLVVCAIQSSQNRFPFRSKDWHLVPSMNSFLMDLLGKSCSLCLFIHLDIIMCC